MSKNKSFGESVIVMRDAGCRKDKILSPEYRNEVRKRVENPDIVTGNHKLKELLADLGIIVNPEKMTNWYAFEK